MEINPRTKEAQFKNCAKRSASYGVGVKKPDIRYLKDMRKVAYDKEWFKKAANQPAYYMYRGVKEENGLRNNFTIIPGKMLGSEFMKTKGHEHLTHQEIYTVIEGESFFLMQKVKEETVEDVYAVKTEKGQSVIIPRYYGHITINPSEKTLTTEDWVPKDSKNDYSLFEKMHGACYYYILRSDSGQAGWIKNREYKKVPKLRFEKPLKRAPKDLSFLKG